jgi:prepilin-type N-terminal cleavage/methylation domain-containing protein
MQIEMYYQKGRMPSLKSSIQQGFTLIELVVVVSIIAILSAVALPRMANIAEDAHKSSVLGTGGGLASAVSLAHSRWLSSGQRGAVQNLIGYGDNTIDFSVLGWPTGVNGNLNPSSMTLDECMGLFRKLLQTSAPSVSLGTNADYQVTLLGGDCRYIYQRDNTGNYIQYDPNTGDVITIVK